MPSSTRAIPLPNATWFFAWCAAVILTIVGCESTTVLPESAPVGEWRAYASDKASSKYTPIDQINKDNVAQLEIAWRWTSVDEPLREADSTLWTWNNESTPLMVDGVLYTTTSLGQMAALDAVTGETKWTYDSESYKVGSPAALGFLNRGAAYWEDGERRRLFYGTGDAHLLALDADTGQPISDFGDNGRIDLTNGLRRPVDNFYYGVTSPPVLCGGAVVVGSMINDVVDLKEMPPGDVRAFDALTGELRWIFESIPQGEDFGVETWEQESWKHTGNTNVWSMMSCDEELGYVYLPFGTPTNDYYGGHRPGDNLFAESLVAVNAETGERAWHFQMVHHGTWDYDLPAAPNLIDLTVDGRPIKAIAQVSKQGFTYVFDRVTGEAVWPIEEHQVAPSTMPGEQTAPTQPFPTKPAAFDRQGVTPDDLIDFTPELRQAALDILEQYDYGSLFTPPTEQGTVIAPGVIGGASWAGAATHPEKGILYIPSVTLPTILTLQKNPEGSPYLFSLESFVFGPEAPQGLPLLKPPYGRITAIDLNTGEHLWMQPMGDGPREHPALKDLDLPALGWPFRTHILVTQTLLFAAQEGIATPRSLSPRGNALEINTQNFAPSLRALDPDDGTIIAEIPLPGNATGAIMTYMADGKQYVVIPIGGASYPAELVALTLPD